MSEVCGDPNCVNDEHWPGGCSAYLRRKRVRAIASTIAMSGLPGVAEAFSRAFKSSGNNFKPCDKCGKPTRGARCHKYVTRSGDG